MKKENKMNSKFRLLTVLVLIVAMLAAMAAVGCGGSEEAAASAGENGNVAPETPVAVSDNLGDSISNSASALGESTLFSSLSDACDEGSIEVQLDMATLAGAPEGTDLALKLFTGATGGVLTAAMGMQGTEQFDASLFFDDTSMALACDLLFGDKVYGLSIDDLANRFNNSVFGPNGAYSLGISASEVEAYFDAMNKATAISEKYMTVLSDMGTKLGEIITNNTTTEKGEQTITVGTASVDTLSVTMKIDSDALVAMLNEVIDYLRTDAELKQFIYDYMDYAMAISGEQGMSADMVVDMIYSELNALTDEDMQQAAEAIKAAAFNGTLVYNVSKTTGELVNVELKATADGETIYASLKGGPSWSDLDVIEFKCGADGVEMGASYVVTSDTDSDYAATLTLTENGAAVFSGNVSWNKTAGDFKAEAIVDGVACGINGNMLVNGTTTTIKLGSAYEGTDAVDLGVTVILSGSDEMPATPDFIDLLDMTVADFEALQQDIMMAVQTMSYMFG